MNWYVLDGDCRERLRDLPDESIHTVVTSPPYFGLRDYGTGEWDGGDAGCDHARQSEASRLSSTLGNRSRHPDDLLTVRTQGGTATYRDACGRCGATRVDRQIGLEPTPDEFVQALVEVFREVRRVLRDDGTIWLNLGDSYASSSTYNTTNSLHTEHGWKQDTGHRPNSYKVPGCKPKDLIGIPWMVAFALRADGWYLRSDIIWAKPNPMPESVTDRPTKAHEYVFLLSKSPRYFYDADAIREPHEGYMAEWRAKNGREAIGPKWQVMEEDGTHRTGGFSGGMNPAGRNKRSVWTVATQPYAGAHFATFPPKLIEPCVLAGCPEGGIVLDPFAGAGTTGLVALQHSRSFIGVELNPEYAAMARARIDQAVRLGFRPPERGPEVHEDQSSLFGAL